VRAAEDGRTGPLPTLAEAIVSPFAKAAERSPTVSKTGEGQSGMRVERVVIEIEHSGPEPINLDDLGLHLRTRLGLFVGLRRINESVRVVEDAVGSVDTRAYADRMGCDEERDFANRITAERDAAIRERDTVKDRLSRVLKSSDSMWSQILVVGAERDKLRARVAELEGCSWVPKAELDALQARVAELEAASGGGQHKVTEGDCLSTVRDAGGRPMPKGPAPGLVAKQAASGGNRPETPDGSSQAANTELPTD
jgi:hypothetical protein